MDLRLSNRANWESWRSGQPAPALWEALQGTRTVRDYRMASLEQVPPPRAGKFTRTQNIRASETTLEVTGSLFEDSALLDMIESCIVPALVEKFLKAKGSPREQRAA